MRARAPSEGDFYSKALGGTSSESRSVRRALRVRHGPMRFVGVASCLLVLFAPFAAASAQNKEQCAQAYEQAQSLQMEHRLLEARAELQVCTNEKCPKQVSADCWRWLANVEASTPTLVITARSAAGEDLVDVTFSIDGRP